MTTYGIVRHRTITDWLNSEPAARAAIFSDACQGAHAGGWPPPSDTDTLTVIPYRWDPDQPDAPITGVPLDEAEFVELRLTWTDPEEDA